MVDKIFDWIKQGKHVLVKDHSKIVYHLYPSVGKTRFVVNVFGIEPGYFGTKLAFDEDEVKQSFIKQSTEKKVEFYEDGDSTKAELLKFGYKYVS